mmetsp:Transcript_30417/g.85972  ORF Transcript_30417/g.85972 Transcript_30417/m.85972 type:complete len:368 (+) Transcript_30417:1177-2280(+)
MILPSSLFCGSALVRARVCMESLSSVRVAWISSILSASLFGGSDLLMARLCTVSWISFSAEWSSASSSRGAWSLEARPAMVLCRSLSDDCSSAALPPSDSEECWSFDMRAWMDSRRSFRVASTSLILSGAAVAGSALMAASWRIPCCSSFRADWSSALPASSLRGTCCTVYTRLAMVPCSSLTAICSSALSSLLRGLCSSAARPATVPCSSFIATCSSALLSSVAGCCSFDARPLMDSLRSARALYNWALSSLSGLGSLREVASPWMEPCSSLRAACTSALPPSPPLGSEDRLSTLPARAATAEHSCDVCPSRLSTVCFTAAAAAASAASWMTDSSTVRRLVVERASSTASRSSWGATIRERECRML